MPSPRSLALRGAVGSGHTPEPFTPISSLRLSPPVLQGPTVGSPRAEAFKSKSGGALPPISCWLLKTLSLLGPQTETESETPLSSLCLTAGAFVVRQGALGLLRRPLCALPSLAMLRSPAMGWAPWPQMEYLFFSKREIPFLLLFSSYGKMYTH